MKYLIAIAMTIALMTPLSSEASFIKEWKEDRGNRVTVEQRQQFREMIRYKIQKIHDFIQNRRAMYRQRMAAQNTRVVRVARRDQDGGNNVKPKTEYRVSEPGTIGLLVLGLLGLGLARRQSRVNASG